ELPSGLGAVRDRQLRTAAIEGRHFEAAAQCRRDEGNGAAAIEIVSLALEDVVRRYGQEDVEIARRAAVHSGLALARQTDARAFLDAARNVDGERSFLLDMAIARAG